MAKKRTAIPPTTAVYSKLFRSVPSRAQQRVIQILEGTIRTYLARGIDGATFDAIAKTCKVSRPLVQHYFPDKEALLEMVGKYIRVVFQELAVEIIRGGGSPRQQLEGWFDSLFVWLERYPHHVQVSPLLYFLAAVNPSTRQANTELVRMGHERATAILEAGVAAGEFPPGDLGRRAKMLQTLYTGAFLTLVTEDLYVDKITFRRYLLDSSLALATSG